MKKILIFFFAVLLMNTLPGMENKANAYYYGADQFFEPDPNLMYQAQSLAFAKLSTVEKDRIRKVIVQQAGKSDGGNLSNIPSEYKGKFDYYIKAEVEKLQREAKIKYDERNRRVGCQPASFYANASNATLDCWVCELVKHMFVVGNNLALRMFKVLATPLKKLAGIALALWILFEIANAFLNFKGINGREMLFNLAKMGLRFTFVFALLGAGTTIFEYTIDPLMDITMSFAMEAHADSSGLVCPQAAQISATNAEGKDLFISLDNYDKICKMINGVYQETRKIMDLGSSFFWKGWNPASYNGRVFPSPLLITTGLVMWLFFAVLYVYFPFTILDSLFKLFILTGLLPIFAVTWLFKVTQDYTSKAFGQILGCCVHLMMVCIVFVIIEAMLTAMFQGDAGGTGIDKLLDACAKGDFMQIISFLEGDQDKNAGAAADIANGFLTILTIMAIGIFSVLAVKKAGELAGEISGASVGGGAAEASLMAGANLATQGAAKTARAGKAGGSYLSNKAKTG